MCSGWIQFEMFVAGPPRTRGRKKGLGGGHDELPDVSQVMAHPLGEEVSQGDRPYLAVDRQARQVSG
jgi:hypothetical protein